MTTQHTPGPWKQDNFLIESTDAFRTWPIATTDGFRKTDVSLANARLIAAAPDLLSALQIAVATIERLETKHGPFSSCTGTLDVARLALAKATTTHP